MNKEKIFITLLCLLFLGSFFRAYNVYKRVKATEKQITLQMQEQQKLKMLIHLQHSK